MQFQTRDAEIITTIYGNDGVMAKRQIKDLFWANRSWRAMEKRLSKLRDAQFIDWPSLTHRKFNPIPEPIVWLDWRGALILASQYGIEIDPPKRINENQMRKFQKQLRNQGIRWVREPRWSLLRHDLAVIDFRLELEKSVTQLPLFYLENWLPESEFRSNMDTIQYSIKDMRGISKTKNKGVCPDAYFEIINEELRRQEKPHKGRFLLEVDMATHDNQSFGQEKIAPGIAYIKSLEYKQRFGYNSGRWLIVTGGGKRRLHNLMLQTERYAGKDSHLFFFITIDDLPLNNLLISRIWKKVGNNRSESLLR